MVGPGKEGMGRGGDEIALFGVGLDLGQLGYGDLAVPKPIYLHGPLLFKGKEFAKTGIFLFLACSNLAHTLYISLILD